jgi:mercuric ion transport protein
MKAQSPAIPPCGGIIGPGQPLRECFTVEHLYSSPPKRPAVCQCGNHYCVTGSAYIDPAIGGGGGAGLYWGMTNKLLLRVGITGTVLAALSCFTPILVIALTALGMASLIPRLDPILIPVLVFFAAFTFWAFSRRNRDEGL